MPTLKLESSGANSQSTGDSAPLPMTELRNNVEVPGLGSITSVRKEIDDVLADMADFHRAEPDMVMAAVSAHGARLTEIIVRIQRIEVVRREWKPVREEAEKVAGELKSQFQIASRLIAIRQMDWEMVRGQA